MPPLMNSALGDGGPQGMGNTLQVFILFCLKPGLSGLFVP